MIRLAKTAEMANKIANLPDVFPYVSWTDDKIDLQPLVDSDQCIIFENDPYGCFVLAQSDYESYVVHTLFNRKTPPNVVMETAKKSTWLSFIELDVFDLTSSACQSNPAAYRLMRKNGFTPLFDSPSRFVKGKKQRMCRLTIDDYIINNDFLQRVGGDFHKLVEETTDHEDDPIHDRYVGAAISMIKAGNIEKAQRVYNKWASLSGYAPIRYDQETNSIIAGYMTIKLTDNLQEIRGVICP
tara:strand:- start:608 stop:1330 length:723 start_codon:yes stop_codon:yes gene_type:complete